MARPKKARSPEDLDAGNSNIDDNALNEAGQALAVQAHNIEVVSTTYDVGQPYNLDVFIARIREHATESALRLIEIGRMLIQIREHETRENYAAALQRIGLGARFAQRAIQTAIKMHDRPTLQQLGVSKVVELMVEDDDTLDELEAGGTLAGKTFDEIDRMTVRELKETLRTERAERVSEKAADEEIIRGKDERINKLMRSKRKNSPEQDVRQQADELLREADDAVVKAASALARLRQACQDVDTLYADAGLDTDAEVAERLEKNWDWAAAELREIAAIEGD